MAIKRLNKIINPKISPPAPKPSIVKVTEINPVKDSIDTTAKSTQPVVNTVTPTITTSKTPVPSSSTKLNTVFTPSKISNPTINKGMISIASEDTAPSLPKDITVVKENLNPGVDRVNKLTGLKDAHSNISSLDVTQRIIELKNFGITTRVVINVPFTSLKSDGFLADNKVAVTDVSSNTITSSPKFESLSEDGSFNDVNTVVQIINPYVNPVDPVILPAINAEVDKTVVTDMNIDDKYFSFISVDDRKSGITQFSFDYLAFLFFESNIEESLPSFYSAIDTIIDNKNWSRVEDVLDADLPAEDYLDPEITQVIFSKIWTLAKASGNMAVKNLIGFYIYFNRRLRFLPVLIQGISVNEFIEDISLETVVDTLMRLGLYPINNVNLFDRVWNSFTYSLIEDGNKAEIKMSLREWFNYDINRDMAETYNGFTNQIDKLIILYDLDLSKWSQLRTFNTQATAFKRFKELSLAYTTDPAHTGMKNYLLSLLPNEKSLFMKNTIVHPKSNPLLPDPNLWCTMQSFDDLFLINRIEINKNKMRQMFMEFANDASFPISYVDSSNFTDLWVAWVEYMNSKASEISVSLADDTGVDHDYPNMFGRLVTLVNAKYIIQYLENNNSFQGTGYVDGADFINAAILKVYESIKILKAQLKDIIKEITITDRRFYPSVYA